MSLINRMLDDLAARQAPGAETLGGVRLSDPMGEAHASLNSRTRRVLIAIALGAAALVWLLWPTRGAIPVPQPRAAVAQPANAAAAAAATVSPPVETAAPVVAQAAAAAPDLATGMRLDTSLTSLHAADPRGARADPSAASSGAPTSIVADDAATPMREDLRAAPEAPASRSLTSIGAPSARAQRSERGPRPAAAPPAEPGVPAAGAQAAAPVNPPPAAPASVARDALARGDPAAALDALGPAGSDRDAEAAALRAAALQRLGRHREAVDAYRGLTQGDPAEPGHWVGLAISLEGQQKREEARIAYRRALQSSRLAPSLRAFAQARVTVLEAP